ncbi:uncharacterized protein EloA [Diabrotica undecimpunctata]|uniref:uncharacterized protein EloA n=1 Tax=Diabrotica undecimpunctata TaxID=50387 RepID=UPI003B642940
MTSSNDDVIKAILQYQERLERYKTSKSEDKIQYVLGKLSKLPIRTSHLETTGVGRTVNALKKFGGEVGEIAKDLVISWKEMVLEEEKAAQETSMETEEDADSNYSSENENKDCGKDVSKEAVSSTSDGNESEGYDSKREVPSRSDTEKKSIHEKYRKNDSRDSSSESSESEEEKNSKYDKHSSSKRRHSSESSSDRHNTKKSSKNKETRKRRDSSDSDSDDRHSSKKSSKDTKKRKHSSESSSDDRHSSKKSRRDPSPKISHKHKSSKDEHKSSKDEKERNDKKDKHSSSKHRENSEKNKSSSEKHKDSSEKSESKHKSKKDSEEEKKHKSKKEHEDNHSSNKSEKHKKPEERENSHLNAKYDKSKKHEEKSDKHSQSSHSSKHRDKESPHSSSDKKNSKEKDKREKEKEKYESKKERKEEKKPKEIIAEQKKSEHSKSKESSSSSKHDSTEKKNKTKKDKEVVKKVPQQKIIHGIDSESGASFAEALGMCGPYVSSPKKKPIVEKKRESNSVDKYVDSDEYEPISKPKAMAKYDDGATTSSSSSKVVVPSLLKEPEPLNISLSSLLPEISPNYKPLGVSFDNQPKRIISDDEALSRVMMNKNQRTKVYSGNKTIGKVESLFQLCVRILQDNIDALEYTGGVPYIILKPIMERATPDQLFNLEHHNPYLIEDTDGLWKLHCQKDFRTKRREEMESWRDMYMRCLDEREAKLNAVTATIKQSQDKSIPVRTTKLAYVETEYVKPPRNVARKQAKNGTVNTDRKVLPSQKVTALAKSGEAEKIAVPDPGKRASDRSGSSGSVSAAAMKPKKAPLMAKTISYLKNRFKR